MSSGSDYKKRRAAPGVQAVLANDRFEAPRSHLLMSATGRDLPAAPPTSGRSTGAYAHGRSNSLNRAGLRATGSTREVTGDVCSTPKPVVDAACIATRTRASPSSVAMPGRSLGQWQQCSGSGCTH